MHFNAFLGCFNHCNGDDGDATMSLGVAFSMDHSYNWSSSAGFSYTSTTDGFSEVTSSDLEFTVSTTKAIINQCYITGSFGYLMPNDGNDDTDDDAVMDVNVGFTYWVF